MAKAKKGFNAGLYAVIAAIVVAVVLVLLTIFAFTTRYTAFSPEKVAQTYVDTIVQTGDGYNAYKNTLVAKNGKYGDFIRQAYMAPFVNDGDDVKQADFVGTGNEEEAAAIDQVYNTMYGYLTELIKEYGMDDYNNIFGNYFARLKDVRHDYYGDEYMDTDFMFGAFEANIEAYGKVLTGTEEVLGADGKTVIQEASTGRYQEMFGENYKFITTVKECTALSDKEVKDYITDYKDRIISIANVGESKADLFELKDTTKEKKILFFKKTEEIKTKTNMINAFANLDNSEAIEAVSQCTVEVTLDDGKVIATQEVYVVQIGNSWYVDETNVDTSSLYLAL